MAKPTRFTPIRTAAGSWRLNIPAAFSETGKRQQLFFPTQREALAAAAPLKEARKSFGEQARAIRPTLAEAAIQAEAMLAPYGVGLIEAAQAYVAREEANRASRALSEAMAAFTEAHPHWSDSHARAMARRGRKMIEAFGTRPLSSITGMELTDHLTATTGGPDAWNQAVRLIRAFWRWSAKPPRSWCSTEPVDHLETRRIETGEIGVLTATQVRALFAAAEKHFPDTVPALAIAVFTGMRQAELARLNPEDITPEGITVPAASAKTKRRRFINMPRPLAAWLAAHPIGETVIPPNWQRKEKAIRRLAGWRVWSDLVPTIDPEQTAAAPGDLPPWPDNAIRHTNASVLLATGASVETLGFEFGHVGGSEMLRRHYAGVMPKKEAMAILGIGPKGKTLETISAA